MFDEYRHFLPKNHTYQTTDKERIGKICSDIHEANHALQSVIINSNGNGHEHNIRLPWLLTEQQSNSVKEVIRKNQVSHGIFVKHTKYLNEKR